MVYRHLLLKGPISFAWSDLITKLRPALDVEMLASDTPRPTMKLGSPWMEPSLQGPSSFKRFWRKNPPSPIRKSGQKRIVWCLSCLGMFVNLVANFLPFIRAIPIYYISVSFSNFESVLVSMWYYITAFSLKRLFSLEYSQVVSWSFFFSCFCLV